ncbi:glycine cleavage system protein GcvH [Nocardiopsis sp. CNT312]|uniref:glycine cleavage system protein GcvH n=1 Tax=Nocardiopsis sp. CNT312 TaxID=1137268 RepID=UPI00048BDFA9|nr:glycine cleavage system protein GcvH [Nocardiopsis sp. CNT312]
MSVPTNLGYTADHEWVLVEGDIATVGVTAYAADALGDVVFVDLPEPGTEVTAGAPCGEVESTKSVSEVYSPVSGEITEVNAALESAPETINQAPYGDGWLFQARVFAEPTDLLSAQEYEQMTKDEE